MKRIEVNNGGYMDIQDIASGIYVGVTDGSGRRESVDVFNDDEIIMTLNLLRYMRNNNLKSAWILNPDTDHYPEYLIRNGDLEEFRIFQ